MPIAPITPPTDDIENLGPDKKDRDLPVDPETFLSAKEWNWAKTYIKWSYGAIQTLALSGAVGTLQNAYANAFGGSNVLPTRILVNVNIGGVVVSNNVSPISTIMLGVSDSLGNNEHGFYADGIKLHGGAKSLYSVSAPVRANSGIAPGAGAAYVFDTANALSPTDVLFSLRNATGSVFSVWPGGNIAGFNTLTGTRQWAIEAAYDGTGMVRWKSDQTDGVSHCPHAPGVGTIGKAAEPWRGVYARYHACSKNSYATGPAVMLNLHAGSIQETTLGADLTINAIANQEMGARLHLIFVQDGTGGRKLLGLPANFQLSKPFRLSAPAGAVDHLWVEFDGVNWVELARRQTRPPESEVTILNIATGGTTVITPHQDAHTIVLIGVLAANAAIDLKTTGAVLGDKIWFIFEDVTGVVTDPTMTFTLAVDALAQKVYNQAKTIRGLALAVFDGASWTLSLSSLSYA